MELRNKWIKFCFRIYLIHLFNRFSLILPLILMTQEGKTHQSLLNFLFVILVLLLQIIRFLLHLQNMIPECKYCFAHFNRECWHPTCTQASSCRPKQLLWPLQFHLLHPIPPLSSMVPTHYFQESLEFWLYGHQQSPSIS